MPRDIRQEPNTEGVHVWIHTHATIPDDDRETFTSWWITLECPQCDHQMRRHLPKGQRRVVCSCSFSECDGAIMVAFDEPGVYDPPKAKVYVMDSTNRWVRIYSGMHQHVIGSETRTNPRWKTGDGLVLGRLTTCSDILPDGKERGVKTQSRKVCSCGWATEWDKPQFGRRVVPDSIEDQAARHLDMTITDNLVLIGAFTAEGRSVAGTLHDPRPPIEDDDPEAR